LQIVRQLISACLPWIHGDVDAHGLALDDVDVLKLFLEVAHPRLAQTFVFDFTHHFGHHGEHVQAYAVELVQAGPGTLVQQPTTKCSYHLGFHVGTAIEYDAVDGQTFTQVFDRFSFACACRSCRCCPQSESKSTGNSVPTPFSQRRDDQSAQGAQVLLALLDACVDLLHLYTLHLHVVPELFLPVEVLVVCDFVLHQHVDHVFVVYLARDDGDDAFTYEPLQAFTDEHALVPQLLFDQISYFDEALSRTFLFEGLLALSGPEQLPDGDYQLRVESGEPLLALHLLLHLHLHLLDLDALVHEQFE